MYEFLIFQAKSPHFADNPYRGRGRASPARGGRGSTPTRGRGYPRGRGNGVASYDVSRRDFPSPHRRDRRESPVSTNTTKLFFTMGI